MLFSFIKWGSIPTDPLTQINIKFYTIMHTVIQWPTKRCIYHKAKWITYFTMFWYSIFDGFITVLTLQYIGFSVHSNYMCMHSTFMIPHTQTVTMWKLITDSPYAILFYAIAIHTSCMCMRACMYIPVGVCYGNSYTHFYE